MTDDESLAVIKFLEDLSSKTFLSSISQVKAKIVGGLVKKHKPNNENQKVFVHRNL